jgi:ribosomal protein L29
MANVNMQTAARDLQRAVSDLRQKEQNIRNDTDNSKRQINQNINALRTEQAGLRTQSSRARDAAVKVASTTRLASINIEIKNLEKQLFQIEDEARRNLQDMEQEAVRLNNLSQQLQNSA